MQPFVLEKNKQKKTKQKHEKLLMIHFSVISTARLI